MSSAYPLILSSFRFLPLRMNSVTLDQGWQMFSVKSLRLNVFNFYGPVSAVTAPLCHCGAQSHKQRTNKRAFLRSNPSLCVNTETWISCNVHMSQMQWCLSTRRHFIQNSQPALGLSTEHAMAEGAFSLVGQRRDSCEQQACAKC